MAELLGEENAADSRREVPSRAESRLKHNIAANLVGRGWMALIQVAFIPLYIKFLGIESYGLVGFYITLQSVCFLLDMGLSTTLNRELACRSVQADSSQDMRDMTRTLEIVYWLVALLIACTVVLLSGVIAHRWIHAEHLSQTTVRNAVAAMGLALALQFPFALYQGGLLGLQRQVLLNGILVVMATLRGAGVVLVLWLVSPTIHAYFVWQIVVGAMQSIISAWFLWRSLPRTAHKPRFNKHLLGTVWRFAAGMTGISALAVLLTQMDKIILSHILTLKDFGYYALATVVAGSVAVFYSPFFIAVFPRFSQLVALDDKAALSELYHKVSQLVSVILLPVAATVVFFSPELLRVWTRNPVVTDRTHLLASILVIGSALNGLMNVPYALQLAHGWTKLALYSNIIASAVLAPTIYVVAHRYGAVGAAVVWVVLNTGYVLLSIQVMHTRLLKGEKLRWYAQDVGLPLAPAVMCVGLSRWLLPRQASNPITIAYVAATFVLVVTLSAFTAPQTRAWLLRQLRKGCGFVGA